MVTVSGNTNPTTKYRFEFDNLNCIFARTVYQSANLVLRMHACIGIGTGIVN